VKGIEAIVESDHSNHTRLLPDANDLVGFPQDRGDRLLEVQMLPNLHRCNGNFTVERSRHTHDDRVNGSHFQDITIIRIGDGRRETMVGFLSPLRIRLSDCSDVHIRQSS